MNQDDRIIMKKEKNVRNRFIGLLLSLSALVLISCSGTPVTNYLPEEKKESRKENAALSIDGPYILYRPDGRLKRLPRMAQSSFAIHPLSSGRQRQGHKC